MQDGELTALAEQQLDALLLSAVTEGGPGAAVLVACGNTPIYRRALGLANVENSVPLTPDSVFRIGSVTKMFTATALLQLCDRGKASLSDTLHKYVPRVPNSANITLSQLLNHTSGIQSYNLVPGYMGNPCRADMTTAELLDSFMHLPPDFPPGHACKYNNSGFVLVGAVLEAITGKPWHEVVLDMLSTVAAPRTSYGADSSVVQRMADGYSTGAAQQLTRASYISMTQPHAAGALVSCLDDLLAFSRALHCGHLLQPDTYAAMCAPSASGLGLGMKTLTVQAQHALGHDGSIPGFASMLLYVPSASITVVLLCNSDSPPADPSALARRIAACAMGIPYDDAPTVGMPIEALQELSGRYSPLPPGSQEQQVELALRDGHLWVGGRCLRHVGGASFVMQHSLARLQFVDGSNPLQLRLFMSGEGPGELWQRLAA
jgi:CubicO group peptidase (beta-lactamase class C family)